MTQLDKDAVAISTHRLTKAFGKVVAVNDLHLQVMRGDVFGFLGPNGSGKTTTIRMLLGLMRPTEGQILIFGMDNSEHLPTILRRLGAIVETPVFYPYLSGLDNLRVVALNSRGSSIPLNNKRLRTILEMVGLNADMKLAYRKYSLGMKQRLGIAATLLHDPELILLDEPTNGLDPAGVIAMRQMIKRLSSEGKTIFLSSHLISEVQQVCNRVAILNKGNLVKQGNVNELVSSGEQIEIYINGEEQTRYAAGALQYAKEHGVDWIVDVTVERNQYNQPVLIVSAPAMRSPEVNMLLARSNLFAAEIHPRRGNLEDLYLQVTPSPSAIANMETSANSTQERASSVKEDDTQKKDEVQ